MKMRKNHAFLALLGVFALAACGESTDVDFDDLTPAEQMELDVLGDPGSFEVALEVAGVAGDVGSDMGLARTDESRGLASEARTHFVDARRAMLAGDHAAALDAARMARRLVARAIAALGGDAAPEALIERIEELAVTADEEVFDDPDALRAELEAIAAEARALLESGDTMAAAARALLGEQIARHRRGWRDHPDIGTDRARLEVQLAGSAVALAHRLLTDEAVPVVAAADTDVPTRQDRWLRYAEKLYALSQRALEAGNLRRAVHFAHHAQWSALKAVVLPGGITEEEIRAMVELAETLLAEATEALGDEPTALQARVLNRAADLIEIGIARLEAGQERGLAALWRASIMCHWLLG